MSKDIVDKLRSDGEGERQYEREARVVLGGLLDAAVDEIGRLRAEVDAARLDERAKIVDWLRCGCGRSDCYTDRFPLNHAKAIEAGEHLK